MSDIILVGGSKDGTVTEGAVGLNSVQNIVLNDDFTGPEFVDRYVSTGIQDREGRDVYAHVGRFTAEESESYWASLDQDEVAAFIEAAKAEREEEERAAAEEAAKEEESATEEVAEEEAAKDEPVEEEKTEEADDSSSEA
jgi:hypothetical protein